LFAFYLSAAAAVSYPLNYTPPYSPENKFIKGLISMLLVRLKPA